MSLDLNDERHITNAFVTALQRAGMGGTGANTNASPSTSSVTGVAGQAWTALTGSVASGAEAVAGFAGKVVRHTATIPDAAGVVANITGNFGKVGEMLGGIGIGLADYMEESIINWRKFSDLGVGMAGDAVGMRAYIGQTRESLEEFQGTYDILGPRMLNFANTMSDGTKSFTSFVGSFYENTEISHNLLRRLGYDAKSMGDEMAITVRGMLGINLDNETSARDAQKAAQNLAIELDKNAKLTGVSRKAQEDNILYLQNQANYMARQRTAMNQNDTSYLEASRQAQNLNATLPKPALDALNQAMSNQGRVSGPALDALSVAAPNTLREIQRLGAMIDKGTEEEKKYALTQMENGRILNMLTKETGNNNSLLYAQNEQLDENVLKLVVGTEVMSQAVRDYGEQNRVPNSTVTALQNALMAIEAEQKGLITRGDKRMAEIPGQTASGAATTELYTNITNRLKDLGSGSLLVIKGLNDELGLTSDAIKKMNTDLNLSNPAEFNAAFKNFVSTFSDKTDALKNIDQFAKKMNISTDIPNTSEKKEGEKSSGGPTKIGSLYSMNEGGNTEGFKSMLDGTIIPLGGMNSILETGMRSILPQLSSIKRDIPTMVSNAVEEATANITEMIASNDQSLNTDKLNEISSRLGQMIPLLSQAVTHTRKTADNTAESSGSVYS
jgi:hypothetical protein